MVKNLPADTGDAGSIPGLGRSPRGGNGNPLQYSCLGNPMDRGAATHEVTERRARPHAHALVRARGCGCYLNEAV